MGKVGAPGRPRDERLDQAIVDATVALVAERGYNALTLSAVADRAGTTTAAIYRRWRSKPELVARAVFRTDGDDVVADTGDLEADLTTMIRWSVEKIHRPAGLAAVGGLLGEAPGARHAVATDVAGVSRRVTERIDRARAAGELRSDVDAPVVAALVAGPVLQAAMTGVAADERWIAGLVSVVLDGARPTTEQRR